MKTILLISTLLILTNPARADHLTDLRGVTPRPHAAENNALTDWNGAWEGNGTFADSVESGVDCEYVRVMLDVKEDSINEYQAGRCNLEAWTDNLDFTVKGEELWLDGEKVGTISNGVLEYTLIQPEEEYGYHQRLELQPDHSLKLHDDTEQRNYKSSVDSDLKPL